MPGGTTMLENVVCSFILTAILIAAPKTEAECTCPSTGCPNRGSEGVCGYVYYSPQSYQAIVYHDALIYGSQSYECSCFIICFSTCYRRTSSYRNTFYYTTHYRQISRCGESCCSGHQADSSNPLTCVPVCSEECVNGGTCINPEECQCAEGWTGANCGEDIDECSTNNGGCDHDCYNSPGSYTCSCNEGYEVHDDLHQCLPICTGGCMNGGTCVAPETCDCVTGWTGTYCENDIDECSFGTSGCQQKCNNTAGGYSCSCYNGFTLEGDGHSCADINECANNNGGCDHACINMIGHYNCSCRPGYTLQEDGLTCVAQPCPHLDAPLNGSISCTGEQVTDEMCSFSCDPGFELLGSSQRLCQPNNTWTGVDTYCNILYCPLLEPTKDSFIVDPCDTVYQSTCMVSCLAGYYRENSGQNELHCVVGNTSDSVQWTQRPECMEIRPCVPNPCRHNGGCSEDYDGYTCDCEGTGYTGEQCQWGLVDLEKIPVLVTNQTFCFIIRANPDMDLTITLSSSEYISIMPTTVLFNQGVKNHTICISSVNEVITQLQFSLSGGDSRQFIIPNSITIVVQDVNATSTYAEDRTQPVGILEPGCCTDISLNYSCPTDNYPVFFTSTCSYSASTSPILIPGISFVVGPQLSLPLSLSACTLTSSYQVELHIDDHTKCQACSQISSSVTCSSSRSGGAGCYCYALALADIRVMLESEALAKTYFTEVNLLLPPWLTLQAVPSNRSHFADSYHTFLASHNNLNNIQSCPYFIHNVATSGLHSILKYHGRLNIGVSNEMKSHFPEEEDNLFCIAVDTCVGGNSPVHVSLPSNHPFNGFLEKWKDHGWNAYLRGLSLQTLGSFVGITHYEFWNGSDFTVVRLTKPHIAVSGVLQGEWRIGNVFNVLLTIDGEFLIEASNNDQILENGLSSGTKIASLGSTDLEITINSASFAFSQSSAEGFFSLSYSEELCNTTNIGMTKLYYTYLDESEEHFISELLPISSSYDTSCPVDVALRFNSSTEVVGLAFQSTCHELVLGALVFSGTDHIISIGGNLSPVACANSVPTASVSGDMAIYTSIRSGITTLNRFISVAQPDNGGSLIVTNVNPITETYTATVHNAQITLWDTRIQSLVIIANEGLKFSGQLELFQGIPVTITGTASTDHPWEDMELRIEGWIHEETNFVQTISNEVQTLLTEESNSAVNHINNAEASLNRLKVQKNATYVVYVSVMSDVQKHMEKCSSIETDIAVMTTSISQLELQIAQSTSATSLHQALESVCQTHVCAEVSIPSLSCMWCTSAIQTTVSEKCLDSCSYNRTVRIQNGTMKVTELHEESDCSPNPYCLSCQHNHNNPNAFTAVSCIGGIFPARCTTYKVPYLKDVPSFVTKIQQASYDCLKDCNISLTYNHSHECCEENNEIHHFSQPNCVVHNAGCRIVQEGILDHLSSNSTFTPAVGSLRELRHMEANLTILRVELSKCNFKLEAAHYRYNQTRRLYEEISQAVEDAEVQLSEIKRINEAGQQVNEVLRIYRWESIFTITNITFSLSSTTVFPNAFLLTVEYSRSYMDQYGLECTFTFDFDFQANSIHDLSVQLKDDILSTYSNRKKRASLSESLRIDWVTLCQDLHGMRAIVDAFLLDSLKKSNSVVTSVSEMVVEIQESVSRMSDELLRIDNITDGINQTAVAGLAPDLSVSSLKDVVFTSREVSIFTELLTEASSVPSTSLSNVAAYAFQQWQVQMEIQLNSTFSNYGHKCVGFMDCLTTSIEIVKDILRIAQHSTADELSEKLLAAEGDVLDLALRDDLTIEEATSRLNLYISILDDATEFDYWCAAPPLARLSSYTDVVIGEGESLQLSCEVESEWSINYEWKKDNETISHSNSGELKIESIKTSESGMYHCIASNHIGSHRTSHIKVIVTTLPVFEEGINSAYIYAESCSPVVLSCDVSSQPDPNIIWYFQPEGSDSYRQLTNESATELQYFRPSPVHTGQYYCEASNIAGAIQSEFYDVRILDSTLTQFTLPVLVSISREGSSRNKRAVVFSYVDTGIDPTQYVTLDEEDNEHNDKLREIIEMELDLGSVSIMKASFDNSSSPSSLTFLLGTRLIPIDDDHTIPLSNLFQEFTDAKNELERVVEKLSALLPYLNYSSLTGLYDIAYGGVDTSTVISRCLTGQGLNDTNYMFCVACPPGEYQVSTTELLSGLVLYAYHTCLPCSDGQYQSNEGQTACIPCKPGFYQDSPGSPSCLTCPKGYYQPEEGQTGCTPCGPGSYTNSTGATTCTLCPEDFYQPDEGQPSCIKCSNGYTTSDTGATKCDPIPTTAPEALEWPIWVVAIIIGLLIVAIFIIVLLLVGVIYKHKRREREEQYGVDDKVCYNPDVYPEVAFSDDPFGIQGMNEDEEDMTDNYNIYDTIDDYLPMVPKGQRHYQVQQLPTCDEDEAQEEYIEEVVKASYDSPLPTQQDGEDTTAVQKAYEQLDTNTMMDKSDHQYQCTFASEDNDDYYIPLTLGHHLGNSSNTEKAVAEEKHQNVDGENTEEVIKTSNDTPLPTQQVGEDTTVTAVQKAYEQLDPNTMMDKTDHQYQGTFTNKVNDDYYFPLTLGRHLVISSNTEKAVAEENYQNVDGENNNVGEDVDTDDDQQPLITGDDVSDQKTAPDEDQQNVGDNEDYQSMNDEEDQVSITDEDMTLM